ncbi:MAG: hypothetical protein AAFY82_07400 [Pseudomonadota bacterium]
MVAITLIPQGKSFPIGVAKAVKDFARGVSVQNGIDVFARHLHAFDDYTKVLRRGFYLFESFCFIGFFGDIHGLLFARSDVNYVPCGLVIFVYGFEIYALR